MVNLFQIMVALADIAEISPNQSIEDMPVMLLPIRRPEEDLSGPYQVHHFKSCCE